MIGAGSEMPVEGVGLNGAELPLRIAVNCGRAFSFLEPGLLILKIDKKSYLSCKMFSPHTVLFELK